MLAPSSPDVGAMRRKRPLISPITPVLGAEVAHIDLAVRLDEACAADLRTALNRYGLLVFRNQSAITRADQVAFAQLFGPLERSPLGEDADPDVVRIIHDATRPPTENIWHVDHSFREVPPRGAVLRAIEVPRAGGDTLFADMRAVFRRLPTEVRALLRDLQAIHDIAKWAPAERVDELHAAAPLVTHPALCRHPETGEETLFVNAAYTTGFVGIERSEGVALLDFLLRHVNVPEVQCRLRWQAGTVAVWDNRALQHYAVGDYFPARRIMERASIAGSGRPIALVVPSEVCDRTGPASSRPPAGTAPDRNAGLRRAGRRAAH